MIDLETYPQHEIDGHDRMTGNDMLAYVKQTEEFTMKNLPFLKELISTFGAMSEQYLHQTINQHEMESEIK